jgi:hypothetical protein
MKPQLFASVTITKEKKAIQTHGKGGVQRFISPSKNSCKYNGDQDQQKHKQAPSSPQVWSREFIKY